MSEDTISTGQRLRRIRKARGKTQEVIAGRAGVTKQYLSQLEKGQRPLNSVKLISALAAALEIDPADLTRLPLPAPGNGHTDSGIQAIRHALEAIDQGSPGGLVLPVDVLRDRLEQLRTARRACRFRDVRDALPGLIRDLHTTISTGRHLAELLPLAVVLHVHITIMWLRDAGAHPDIRREVSRLARDLAREHGELSTLGVATFGRVNALRGAGMFDRARAELDAYPLPPAAADTVDMVGTLLEQHAAVAASDGRAADAEAAINEAAELAQRFGDADRGGVWFGFGPTAVCLKRMMIALEADEPDKAVHIAEEIQPERAAFPTRQAAYHVDYGRALAALRGRHRDAVRALRAAENMMPNRVYRNPLARETISGLLTQVGKDAVGRELRGMAYRAGVEKRSPSG